MSWSHFAIIMAKVFGVMAETWRCCCYSECNYYVLEQQKRETATVNNDAVNLATIVFFFRVSYVKNTCMLIFTGLFSQLLMVKQDPQKQTFHYNWSKFLQTSCPSRCPTNSVKALKKPRVRLRHLHCVIKSANCKLCSGYILLNYIKQQ